MRVGIIAIQHESNTFLSTPTTLEHFRADTLLSGPAVREKFLGAAHELGGFFAGFDDTGIDVIPLLAAVALPSGVITASTETSLIETMLKQLDAAGKLDGFLVAPHGAAVSESHADMDGYWLRLLRDYVGPDVPLVCTLDLHANVSQAMTDACDATIAYRSNPHLDQRERGIEAAHLLLRTLRGEVKPVQAAAMPAVAINIERQQSGVSPCRELFAFADSLRREPGVLSNSVVLGFPYADVAEFGTSFIAVTDDDERLAAAQAEKLADYLWRHRQDFVAELIAIDEALQLAERHPGTTCLLDMGDNVGGGSAADGTWLAQALHEKKTLRAFVSLYDPEAVQLTSAAGAGGRLRLAMGGKTDDLHGPPLSAEVTVTSLHEGRFIEKQTRHGGRSEYDMGKTAVVQTDHGLTIQLTSKRVPPFSLEQLHCCNVDPGGFDAIVAKGVVAPVAAYQAICTQFIRVNTRGSTTADMLSLPYVRRRKPLFPFES